jgi:hypothetical protein
MPLHVRTLRPLLANQAAYEFGEELQGLDAAEHEAAVLAATLGRDRLPDPGTRKVIVEVRNEYGQRVLTVTAPMEVERVEPEPTPPSED